MSIAKSKSKAAGVRVRVFGLQAQGLRSADRNGLSDPFAVLVVGRERHETEVVPKTLDPVWTVRGDCEFGRDENLELHDGIRVKLYDKDAFGKDKLGEVFLPFDDLWDNNGAVLSAWRPVIYQGSERGRLFASMTMTGYVPVGGVRSRLASSVFTGAGGAAGDVARTSTQSIAKQDLSLDTSGEVPAEPSGRRPSFSSSLTGKDLAGLGTSPAKPVSTIRPPNMFMVTIIRAKGILGVGSRATSDAFVKVYVGGLDPMSTAICPDSVTPTWNETFAFPVRERTTEVRIVLEHHRTMKNQFLGKFQGIVSDYWGPHDEQWIQLVGKDGESEPVRGDLCVQMQWVFNEGFNELKPIKLDVDAADSSSVDGGAGGSAGEVLDSEVDKEAARKAVEESMALLEQQRSSMKLGEGDYQVQVHVIEVRDLKAEDLCGTSDPVVVVEVAGKKQSTAIKSKTLNAVFDEVLFFSLHKVGASALEKIVIRAAVYDSNTVMKDVLIGLYQFDFMDVYYAPNHEIWRQWVALVDPLDAKDKGVQGYLKVSITALGPNDKPALHTPLEEAAKDAADNAAAADSSRSGLGKLFGKGGSSGGIASLCLMPPSIKRELHFLVVSVYRADGLPAMDTKQLGGLLKSGIDAFVQVDFAGNPPAKTQWKNVRGDGNLSVVFKEQLWIPVMTPAMSNTIALSVWDYDRIGSNDRVGCAFLRFDDVMKGKYAKPSWVHLYGAPDGIWMGDAKNAMNKDPDIATNWRGQLLIAAREDVDEDKREAEEVHRKRISSLPPPSLMPAELQYRVRAVIVSGAELPNAKSLHVLIKIGRFEKRTAVVPCVKGGAVWKAVINEEVKLPFDLSQMPDTFVYLCKGSKPRPNRRICYKRFKSAELISVRDGRQGVADDMRWHQLHEDKAIDAIKDGVYPGSLLFRLRLMLSSDDDPNDNSWADDIAAIGQTQPYELRVHLYQARNLPAADDTGTLDPYVLVRFQGEQLKSATKMATCNPMWYQTLTMDVSLPELRFCPQVLLEVWDWDKVSSNDYVCEYRHSFTRENTILSSADALPAELPDPTWVALTHPDEADAETKNPWGSLLVSFQLVKKVNVRDPVDRIPETIQPVMEDWFVEVIVVGLRNMAPYQLTPILNPFLEFDCGDKTRSTDFRATKPSKVPSGTDPNFLERMLLPVKIPRDPLYAPSLNITVKDSRLGGLLKPVIGVTSIPLEDKLPWLPDYKPRCAAAVVTDGLPPPPPPPQPQPSIQGASNTKSSGAEEAKGTGLSIPFSKSLRKLVTKSANTPGAPPDAEATWVPSIYVLGDKWFVPPHPALALEDGYDPNFKAWVEKMLSAVQRDAASRKLKALRGEDTVDEPDEKKYMKVKMCEFVPPRCLRERRFVVRSQNRRVYDGALEDVFENTPFETYPVMRGQIAGRGSVLGVKVPSSFRQVGTFKGLIRIVKSTNEPPPLDISKLFNPQPLVVRVYALSATGVQPNTCDDPYLKLKLGDVKVNGVEHRGAASATPEFFRMYELPARLPGPSQLSIELWDYDKFSGDDFIAKTVVDLEDRWFEQAWHALGADFETKTRFRLKPVEVRPLMAPTSRIPQGMLRLWVDILTTDQAKLYPPVKIEKPPPEQFEVRMVLWRADKVKCMDEITGMNDLFGRVWMEGMSPQETDIHWRARKGKGSWNWRFKFVITLPSKQPRIHIQLWDKDVFKWSDHIAETMIDLTDICKRVRHGKERMNLKTVLDGDKKDKPAVSAPVATQAYPAQGNQLRTPATPRKPTRKQRHPHADDDGCIMCGPEDHSVTERLLSDVEPPVQGASVGFAKHVMASLKQRPSINNPDTSKPGNGEVEVVVAAPYEPPAVVIGEAKSDPDAIVEVKQDVIASKEARAAPVLSSVDDKHGEKDDRDSKNIEDKKEEKDGGGDGNEDEDDDDKDDDDKETDPLTAAKETLASVKKLLGIEDEVTPQDGIWLDMHKTNMKTKKREFRGKVLFSLEILPKADADKLPAGFGREAPNANPFLPPPSGRLKFSLNPFKLMFQFLGPGLCFKLCCCLIFVVIVLACVFLAPFLNVMISWMRAVPHPGGWILGFGLLALCCYPICNGLIAYCRFKYGKKTEKGRKDGFAGKAKEEWDTKGAKEGNRPQPKPGVRYRGDAK